MYTTQERVGASRTGGDGRIKLVSAVDMMQDCSQLWLESEPSLDSYLRETNRGILLAYRQIDVLRRPAYGERLSVTTSIFDCKSYFGHRNTVIRDEGGQPCMLSWSLGAFVELDSGRLFRVPEEIAGGIVYDDKLDMDYTPKKIRVPDGELLDLGPRPVLKNDIDLFGHVNNARYIEAAMELLPTDFAVSRLRVEYKRPALLGDVLHAERVDAGDSVFVLLCDQEGHPYTVMEFCSSH